MLDMITKKLETLSLHIIRINKNLYIIIYSKLLYSPKIIRYCYSYLLYCIRKCCYNIKESELTRCQIAYIMISNMLKNKVKLEGKEMLSKYV